MDGTEVGVASIHLYSDQQVGLSDWMVPAVVKKEGWRL